jgi:hypothetical protein
VLEDQGFRRGLVVMTDLEVLLHLVLETPLVALHRRLYRLFERGKDLGFPLLGVLKLLEELVFN